jgi:hypothetical protein
VLRVIAERIDVVNAQFDPVVTPIVISGFSWGVREGCFDCSVVL